MTWSRLSDDMDENRKLRRTSDATFRLYWLAVSWTRRHKTGGRLYMDDVEELCAKQRLRNPKALIAELLEVPYDHESGLWEEIGPGLYEIHDFADFNPPTSTERVRKHRSSQRNGARADSPVAGNALETFHPVALGVTGNEEGAEKERPSRARRRAGYPNPVPKPREVPPTSELSPPTPSPGSGTLIEDFDVWCGAYGRALDKTIRPSSADREAYRQARGDGYSAERLLALARGVPLSPWHMGKNDSHMPMTAPRTVLLSTHRDTFIELGLGERLPSQAQSSAAKFDAVADAMESGSVSVRLRLVGEGQS